MVTNSALRPLMYTHNERAKIRAATTCQTSRVTAGIASVTAGTASVTAGIASVTAGTASVTTGIASSGPEISAHSERTHCGIPLPILILVDLENLVAALEQFRRPQQHPVVLQGPVFALHTYTIRV
jgi:hypothetical protein